MSDPVARLNAALEGRYAIERELGEGGMATVYLADDLKHERKVALKVLKPELAAVVGAERFLAEIKTTANLTHPHILPLHDSGEADGFLFYVMPYLEGENLADRIDREKQLPVDEAVALASKVAGALQHAHEHGVIHRDIKPGNILLQDGEPVVADFGIALALGVAGGTRLTETGLSVGTPFYMSPEQATGDQAVGASTDTYALGSVLYEMLVDDPPFAGSTAQAVLGKIIAGKSVSVRKERTSIPANVDAAVRKALEKLPADRFASAQEFGNALGDEHFRYGELVTAGQSATLGPWNRLSIGLASLATILTLTLVWSLLRPEAPRPTTRVSVLIPEDQSFHPSRGDFDLSNDGSLLVYRGVGDEGQPQLWARRWDALDATPIRDTDGAGRPAISPDGREVAFNVSRGVIRVVPLQGGVSRTLTDSAWVNGGPPQWSPDGAWIYFTNPSQGLSRLPAGGGIAEIVTVVDTATGYNLHVSVDGLPGDAAVYHASPLNPLSSAVVPRIQAVDVGTGEVKDLTAGRHARYSSTGHLLFQDPSEGILLAAPFDAARLELTGEPFPLADGLLVGANNPISFTFSQTGRLVYRTGTTGEAPIPVWVERDGSAREIDSGWSVPGDSRGASVALSPDNARLALSIGDSEGNYDLWVKQLDTGPLSRLTFEGGRNVRGIWAPDGQSVTFVSNFGRASGDLWTKRADGSGTAELVLDRDAPLNEVLYSPDGAWLIFREGNTAVADIYAVRPGVDSEAVPLVVTEFAERAISLSPNGRWLAYVSNRSGRDEVYVVPFPDAGASLRQVSVDGGTEPRWAHSGEELFYVSGAAELVAVEVDAGASFAAGRQDVLFSVSDYMRSPAYAQYDVSPDDQRFIMRQTGEAATTELIWVENWVEELRQRMGN